MDLTLVLVPYDLGRENVGSGRGPQAYLDGGAAEALRARGHEVEVVTVRRGGAFTSELDAVLDVDAAVAAQVAAAARVGRLPLVLAGNCNVTLGVRSGLLAASSPDNDPDGPTIVWLDAHGDFNTPATTRTGYLDGMPLAMLTNRAYPTLWKRLGGAALDERLALHAGGRDLDPGEAAALSASRVIVVSGSAVRDRGLGDALRPALDELAQRTKDGRADLPSTHLHIDIDVLDPTAAPSVAFPAPGGFTLAELLAAIDMVAARFRVEALSLTSFAPGGVDDTTTRAAGLAAMMMVAHVALL